MPFGVFAGLWAFVKLHEIVAPDRAARFDIGGMTTFPLGMASLLAGLTFVIFLLGAVLSAAAVVCSSLRGHEAAPGKPPVAPAGAAAGSADARLASVSTH